MTASPTPFFAESAGETDHSPDARSTVSAAVPTEEDVARAIHHATPRNRPYDFLGGNRRYQLAAEARSVLALFEPVLAEKERRIREMAMQALADDQQLTASLDRALTAEAALAKAYAALHWATKWMTPSVVSRDPEFVTHHPAIDAAIRARATTQEQG